MKNMATREKGLIGEHMVDYHELKRLGGNWVHDTSKGEWSPPTVRKLNVDKRPVNLSLADLPKVNHAGIDAVWEHNGHYTVTEAKASASIAAAYGFGKYKTKKGWIPTVSGLNPDLELLHYLLSDNDDKVGQGSPLMQMSKAWVRDRIDGENVPQAALEAIIAQRYSRRTVLITYEADGANDHAQALVDLHLLKSHSEVHAHADHGVVREWSAAAIDALAEARRVAHHSNAPKEAEGVPQKTKASRVKRKKSDN